MAQAKGIWAPLIPKHDRLSLTVFLEKPAQTSNWKEETIYDDGDNFFSTFEVAIKSARISVYIETYIFDLDALGLKILKLLEEAVQRGVEVKILLDGVGSSQWTYKMARYYRSVGIEVLFFHPLLWQRPSFLFKLPDFRMMNHRDHRKLYIVDKKIGFIGSMNISARHLKSLWGKNAWRDTSVTLTGDPVSALLDSFWVSWTTAALRSFRPRLILKRFFTNLKFPILLKHTLRQRRIYRKMIISRIEQMNERLWITTPYFVPDRAVLNVILDASKRGVDVRLLFPKISDFFGVKYAMEGMYSKLLEANIKIFEYLPTMLHAKILMIDDFYSLGSSNLNHRSFFRDLELDVILNLPKTKALLQEQFLEDLKHAELRTRLEWKKRSYPQKVLEKFFYLFRGVL